jgi:hypothetical protein
MYSEIFNIKTNTKMNQPIFEPRAVLQESNWRSGRVV